MTIPPGFYRLGLEERRAVLATLLRSKSKEELGGLLDGGGLDPERANLIVENVLGVYALPFSLAVNIVLNGKARVAPMVVEEPSVVAAASNASKMIASGGGVRARLDAPLMIAQIEVRDVVDLDNAKRALDNARPKLIEKAGATLSNLVKRGGGPKELELREIGPRNLVVHLKVDVRDAMGANLVNSAAEALGPEIAALAGGRLGLCILTNLTDERVVSAECEVPGEALVGRLAMDPELVMTRIEEASIFAELDPYRAATHNKGIMNGIDSVVLATGNDYRAVEAGAHAYAARSGRYTALGTWRRDGSVLRGKLELPLALGTVGGTLRVHPLAALALEIGEVEGASDLAMLASAVGMASNLAALRALSTEGIQRGHMSLHARGVAVAAGASADEVPKIAALLVERGTIDRASAETLLSELRSK